MAIQYTCLSRWNKCPLFQTPHFSHTKSKSTRIKLQSTSITTCPMRLNATPSSNATRSNKWTCAVAIVSISLAAPLPSSRRFRHDRILQSFRHFFKYLTVCISTPKVYPLLPHALRRGRNCRVQVLPATGDVPSPRQLNRNKEEQNKFCHFSFITRFNFWRHWISVYLFFGMCNTIYFCSKIIKT